MSDLGELQVFVAVVDAGSFVGAARALGLPASTVSRRVARLEARLEARLLERTTRAMRVTTAGERLYERAAVAVREALEAELAVKALQDEPRGALRVTSVQLFARSYLLPIAERYMRCFPRVSVEIEVTGRIVDLIAEGYDLAIRVGALPDSSLIARRLKLREGIICASHAYLAARGHPKHPKELEGHEFIHWHPQGGPWHVEHEGRRWEVPVQGRLRVSKPELAFHAAARGVGIARLPGLFSKAELEHAGLVKLFEGSPPPMLHVVYPSRHLPTKARVFLEMLIEAVEGGESAGIDGLG